MCTGQSLVDSISAALYNVVFTSVPVLLFCVFDRPVKNFTTFLQYPQARTLPPHHILTLLLFKIIVIAFQRAADGKLTGK